MPGCVNLEGRRWFKLFIADVLNSRGLARRNDPFVVKNIRMEQEFFLSFTQESTSPALIRCVVGFLTLLFYLITITQGK